MTHPLTYTVTVTTAERALNAKAIDERIHDTFTNTYQPRPA
ncbi:MAG: hypothetical protein ACLU1W_03210 [Collinsella sp.]